MKKIQAIVKVNDSLWEKATTLEKDRIALLLRQAGSLKPDWCIQGTPEVPEREIAEIHFRVRLLERRHEVRACRGHCRSAFHAALAACGDLGFADQRKRCTNAALQAYELCMATCASR